MKPLTDPLSPNLSVWHRYDPSVKADLFSTRLRTAADTYLVDPIPLSPTALQDLLGSEKVAGIIITNRNHARAAIDFARKLNASILAHPEAAVCLEGCDFTPLHDGDRIAAQVTAVAIEGAAPGEVALHDAAEGGTVILGDALINMGSLGFDFLPAKYCSNPKRMRRSLRKLLDYRFERMLFAHGMPIVAQARDRLATLLSGVSSS